MMRDFKFEYTDTKFIIKLFGLCFLLWVALLFTISVTKELIGVIGSLVLAFGTPLLIFFLNKKKIKKQGTANITDTYSEFRLADSIKKIVYADMRTYLIQRFNGTCLKIKFKDGKTFALQANSNFCNPYQFDTFCQEFEGVIEMV